MSAIDTRNVDRESLFLLADISVDGQDGSARAKVRNLSAGGMMAEGELDVERGSRITVTLRNIGKIAGSVAWVQGTRFGVAFEAEIDPKQARSPVATIDNEAPIYARPALDAPRYDGWNGKLRKI